MLNDVVFFHFAVGHSHRLQLVGAVRFLLFVKNHFLRVAGDSFGGEFHSALVVFQGKDYPSFLRVGGNKVVANGFAAKDEFFLGLKLGGVGRDSVLKRIFYFDAVFRSNRNFGRHERSHFVGVGDFLFKPLSKPLDSLQNFRLKNVVRSDHDHNRVVASENFLKLVGVNFDLLPILKPCFVVACHLELWKARKANN